MQLFKFKKRYTPGTFIHKLEHWAKKTPHNPALLSPTRKDTSFKYLFQLVKEAQDTLQQAGIVPKSYVGILVDEPTDFVVAALAVSTGAVVIPIALSITPDEAKRTFKVLQLNTIITDRKLPSPIIEEAIALNIRPIYIASEKEQPCGTFRLINTNSQVKYKWKTNTPENLSIILQTTGSTSTPKIVPIREKAIVETCLGSIASLELTSNDRCLNFMPMNHVHGLVTGVYLSLIAGASCILSGGYTREGFFEWLETKQPTWFSTSPTVYKDIIKDLPPARRAALKKTNLRFIRIGSAPMTAQFGDQLEQLFDAPLIQAYGMTETLQMTGIPIDKPKKGSVGRSISPEIVIYNDQDQPCKPYKAGRIMVKGDTVFDGYLDNEDTSQSFFNKEWFFTGDLGWLDDEGYLFISGRLKEMINRGGEKIAPVEIESILYNFSDVHEVVVFGIPHATLGEEVAVAIVKESGTARIDIDKLKKYLAEKLSAHKVPSLIIETKSLPKTDNGKIIRNEVYRQLMPLIQQQQNSWENRKPQTPTQKYVFEWFKNTLGIHDLGIDDDFAVLGGISLDVVDLLGGMSKEIGEVIHVVSFMRAPTVAKFAKTLETEYQEALKKLLDTNSSKFKTNKVRVINNKDVEAFKQTLPTFVPNSAEQKVAISPVFILSAPRTGSTLLRSILAGNSSLFAPPELRLMHYHTMDEWKQALSGEYTFYQEGLARAVMSAFGLGFEDANDWIDEKVAQKAPIESIYSAIQQVIKPKVFVDKTPHYSLDINLLNRIETTFDKPKFIHLCRNPIDTKRSFEKSHMDQLWMYDHRYSGSQLGELIWHRSNQNIVEFFETIPEERKHAVLFEDLVKTPEQVTQQASEFIGVSFEAKMLNVHDNAKQRMTDGAIQESKMIGDPNFFEHKRINSEVVGSGYFIDQTVSASVSNLSKSLGYLTRADLKQKMQELDNSEETYYQEMMDVLQKLFLSWKGEKLHEDSLIVGRNTSGTKPPLFWCTQGYHELDKFAAAMGEDQPVYGMRSAHLISKRPDMIKHLSGRYAKEIRALKIDKPLIIGGNCQGARIIWEVAQAFIEKGNEIALLCIMEVNIKQSYFGRLALFYGRNSEKHNPYLAEEEANPDEIWKTIYNNYTVDIISGQHGKFFTEENLPDLVHKLKARMKEVTSVQTHMEVHI